MYYRPSIPPPGKLLWVIWHCQCSLSYDNTAICPLWLVLISRPPGSSQHETKAVAIERHWLSIWVVIDVVITRTTHETSWCHEYVWALKLNQMPVWETLISLLPLKLSFIPDYVKLEAEKCLCGKYFGNKSYLGVGFIARKWSNERLRGILGTERSQSSNQ